MRAACKPPAYPCGLLTALAPSTAFCAGLARFRRPAFGLTRLPPPLAIFSPCASTEQHSVSAYGALGTLFHDAVRPRACSAEVAWYAAHLPRDAGPVLDAMAGSGRLLVPLIQAGIQVHGVDNSDAMLASCERRLAAAGRTTRLYRQSVAALNLPARYAAGLIAAGAFQLLA